MSNQVMERNPSDIEEEFKSCALNSSVKSSGKKRGSPHSSDHSVGISQQDELKRDLTTQIRTKDIEIDRTQSNNTERDNRVSRYASVNESVQNFQIMFNLESGGGTGI